MSMSKSKKKLNLDTFNDILFGALKEQTPEAEKEMLEAELEAASEIFMGLTGELLDELIKNNYASPTMAKIQNVKLNCEKIMYRLAELDEHWGKVMKEAEADSERRQHETD